MSVRDPSSENNAPKSCAEFRSNVKSRQMSLPTITQEAKLGRNGSANCGFSRNKRQQGDQNFPQAKVLKMRSSAKGLFVVSIIS